MMLELAYETAQKAHKGQKDKAGKDYFLHPLYVSNLVNGEEAKIIALLHDVVEDTEVTLEDLRQLGFHSNVISAINAITKRSGEPYDEYIKRLSQNKLAVQVKLADLEHNSDLSRIANPTEKDYARVEKYKSTIEKLNKLIQLEE